jgi:SAM-dependent methyltransferase
MKNPWLDIPLDDYEGHMSSADVGQLQTLNKLFKDAVQDLSPKSIAVVGCSGGNGFEHIDPSVTERVVGIDINSTYLSALHERYYSELPGLELKEQDFASPAFHIAPVEMVFAALVFEYVPLAEALGNVQRCLEPGGTLVAALQRPSASSSVVSKTPFRSLETLAPVMALVDPADFDRCCSALRLRQAKQETVALKQGKSLFVGHYRKG